MKKTFIAIIPAIAFAASCCGPKDGEYIFRILATNDVHGCYFDSLYVNDGIKESLLAVSWHVDSVRAAVGAENVIVIDAGDCLQGDNAAYYYNYIDTVPKHVYARMAEYIGYDAVAVGNHDIETGHPVYDRMLRTMKIPFLAANAIRTDNGKPYFPEYVTLERQGIRITVIGFTNPNIRNWLSPVLWEGMEFKSLIPTVQETVDRIRVKEHPDAVVVAVHSGTGEGDGQQYENQGLDLFKSLKGVDFLICSHDHRPALHCSDSICLINSGSHCRNIGSGTMVITVEKGKVVSKALSADLIKVDKQKADVKMRELFRPDYEAVKSFTLKHVGELKEDLRTSDAYKGMCGYMNLIHTISLGCTPAQISFAAPLTFNGYIKAGNLLYNDLFTIYPYENQLFVIRMTGKEIKDYLEYSYDTWINTLEPGSSHVLKIVNEPDPRTGQERWSFVNRPYNFDSAAGLVYEVDVTRKAGNRITVKSLADLSPFSMEETYNVAMTSYRASGGGSLMRSGAGIDTDRIGERISAYYPGIRNILYEYLMEHGTIDPGETGNPEVIGKWKFIPEDKVGKMIDNDMELLFQDS